VMEFKHCLRHNEAVQTVKKHASELDPTLVGPMFRNLTRPGREKPMAVVLLLFELEELGAVAAPEMARALGWLAEHQPDLPDVRLVRAERLAEGGRWQEVVDLLAPIAAGSSPSSDLCPYHAHHLTAFAFLHLGDIGRARETLDRVGAGLTPCPFGPLRELCTPLPDPLPAEAWGRDRPFLVQLVGVALHADACLARGDPAAALAVLARDPFSTSTQVQILARLAEAWLRTTAEGQRARRHKMTALGRFVDAHAEKDPERRRDLLLPGATWDTARLDEVFAQARAWLDDEE